MGTTLAILLLNVSVYLGLKEIADAIRHNNKNRRPNK